ncbi:hypothetical protein FHU33_3661 [Blastococcus colisei]|uniref:Uncharacterized protein n=1 Tax=Blastococcus colisei TaxID=1564162 RepID=A0A543PJC9_9ACTN|nr:hypothetical protein [Blastococcus colisei]TQN44168.1 hypothetical protein FHU33_3661 [Blastococcus colisei]
MATDGQRLIFLQRTGTGAAPLDEAAFAASFAQTFEMQQVS